MALRSPLPSPIPSPAKTRLIGTSGYQTFVLRFDLSSLDAGYRVYILPDWLPGMRQAAFCTTTISKRVVSLQCTFQVAGSMDKDSGFTILVRRLNNCTCCNLCPSRRVTGQANLRRRLDDTGGVAVPVTFERVNEDEDGLDTTFSPKKKRPEPSTTSDKHPGVPSRRRRLDWGQ